eukprot:m.183201 g.183201  ORF g.183201 m.183201 type:complete len:657 (+) comp15750_c0_seq1:362-2332(+)
MNVEDDEEEEPVARTVETAGLKETAAVIKKLFEGSWDDATWNTASSEEGSGTAGTGASGPAGADGGSHTTTTGATELSADERRQRQLRAVEEAIQLQSTQALEAIEAEYKGGEETFLDDPEKHVTRFMTLLSRLTLALERIPRPVPPFTKDSVLYKVLADGWLDILTSTLQAPVTEPLYHRSIETISTILLVGNIRGRYNEPLSFAKLIMTTASGLSQVAAVFREYEANARATGTEIPPKIVDDLPMEVEACIRLLGVVSWVLEDHTTEAVRVQWRSNLIQGGLVTFAMNILCACDSVLLLDRSARCLASAFEIHAAHEIVMQSEHLFHHLIDKVVHLYSKRPAEQDCGAVPYILLRLLYNQTLLENFLEYDESKGSVCRSVMLDALQACDSTTLALTSFCRILGLMAHDDEAALDLLDAGALDVLADAAVAFEARRIAPPDHVIKVLHELIHEGAIQEENKDVITKHFLSSLSTAVAANLGLLEFLTALHRGLRDSQMDRIEAQDIVDANLAEDSLLWLLVSLSRSAAVITRIAELFPTKDIPMAVYIVATFCATSQCQEPDAVPDSVDIMWEAKRREWVTHNPTVMMSVSASDLLGRCDQCAKLPEQQGHLKICSRCRKSRYCSQACQKAAWKQHKRVCVAEAASPDQSRKLPS